MQICTLPPVRSQANSSVWLLLLCRYPPARAFSKNLFRYEFFPVTCPTAPFPLLCRSSLMTLPRAAGYSYPAFPFRTLCNPEARHPVFCCLVFPLVFACLQAAIDTLKEDSSMYICPVYRTQQRGATFIFNAQLRTKYPSAKWIMGGVAMILDIGTTL